MSGPPGSGVLCKNEGRSMQSDRSLTAISTKNRESENSSTKEKRKTDFQSKWMSENGWKISN